jgi:hypothetical protein
MVADSAFQVSISDDVLADFDEPGPVAGTPEHRFSPAFLRLTSDGGGGALFVDLRPGEQRGRVSEWDRVDGSYSPEPTEWANVAVLLETVVASLTTGQPFMRYFLPRVADGRLEWDFSS